MSDFRVYVSNIPWSTTEHDLALLFDEKMGPCVSLVTIGRGKNGMARGFAFVSFVNQQFCDRALSESGKIVLDGRILRVCTFAYERGCGFFIALLHHIAIVVVSASTRACRSATAQ